MFDESQVRVFACQSGLAFVNACADGSQSFDARRAVHGIRMGPRIASIEGLRRGELFEGSFGAIFAANRHALPNRARSP